MKGLSHFVINIAGLEEKDHRYTFPVDDTFFSHFENSEIQKGALTCKALLSKSSSLIRVSLDISGTVELTCDRSLDLFDFPLMVKGNLLYKYGQVEGELDENIMIISRNTQQILLAQPVYELIVTSIPMKKLHPKFQNGEDEKDEIVFSTFREAQVKDNPEPKDEQAIDPRWEKLKKLKN